MEEIEEPFCGYGVEFHGKRKERKGRRKADGSFGCGHVGYGFWVGGEKKGKKMERRKLDGERERGNGKIRRKYRKEKRRERVCV